jgi:hypothetical protein
MTNEHQITREEFVANGWDESIGQGGFIYNYNFGIDPTLHVDIEFKGDKFKKAYVHIDPVGDGDPNFYLSPEQALSIVALLAGKEQTCEWKWEPVIAGGCWETECGGAWLRCWPTPIQQVRYCPNCGRKIVVKE